MRKNGSARVLDWKTTPIVEERAMYGVARDVTERRQAETERERLADEQAALRRVATLVAQGVPPGETFSAVSKEVGRLFETDMAAVGRFDPDGPAHVVVGLAKTFEGVTVGSRWELDDSMTVTRVYRSGRSARLDRVDWSTVNAPVGEVARRLDSLSGVSSPITVEGRMWGAITVSARVQLPPDAEERLEKFTGLVATAIANAESRGALGRLAEEQAALRRVAELVAREPAPAEIFTAIAHEIGRLLGTDEMRMMRYDSDREAVVIGADGPRVDVFPVGSRWPLGAESVATHVFRTGQPARIDDYRTGSGRIVESARSMNIRAVVGTPILVRGQLWGTMLTGTFSDEPLPPDTESRLVQFTELMGTAIGNAEARAEVEQLADEQAALRRVATLVAEGASPAAVFDAVAAEIKRLFHADYVVVSRYEPGAELTVLAHRGSSAHAVRPGMRICHDGDSVEAMVRGTERSARLENYEKSCGAIPELAGAGGVLVAVGAPIVVDGRLWGVVSTGWKWEQSPPADTEERMVQFAQLLDTAIANADTRDQLTASRARLLLAGDEARRRVVHDLHDGAQQRLVHTIVTLKFARRALQANDGRAESLMDEALRHAERGNSELRELAHGLLPAALTNGGLRGGIDTIVSRFNLPVHVDVSAARFPAEIEASAYFIVAEALTNIMKHARAGSAEVRVSDCDGVLKVEVRDDGVGGADPDGHGLVGMSDRVATLGGLLTIESPVSGGTLVSAALPLSAA
jgi:signal transduction histidine kinase